MGRRGLHENIMKKEKKENKKKKYSTQKIIIFPIFPRKKHPKRFSETHKTKRKRERERQRERERNGKKNDLHIAADSGDCEAVLWLLSGANALNINEKADDEVWREREQRGERERELERERER